MCGFFSLLPLYRNYFGSNSDQVGKKIFSLIFYSHDSHHGFLDLVSYHNSSSHGKNIPSIYSCYPCAEKSVLPSVLPHQTIQLQSC